MYLVFLKILKIDFELQWPDIVCFSLSNFSIESDVRSEERFEDVIKQVSINKSSKVCLL